MMFELEENLNASEESDAGEPDGCLGHQRVPHACPHLLLEMSQVAF